MTPIKTGALASLIIETKHPDHGEVMKVKTK